MLYVGARLFEYTIPLFVENVNFKSTFYPKFIEEDRKNGQFIVLILCIIGGKGMVQT